MEKLQACFPGGVGAGNGKGSVDDLRAAEADAHNEHSQHGPYAAQSHHAEAVVLGLLRGLVAGRHANAQGHDEGHGDGPGGDAAGVKGHCQKFPGDKHGKQEHPYVKDEQQVVQREPSLQGARYGQHQKHPYPCRHGEDNHHVGHGGHLVGQDLQVRLRHGDEGPDEEHQRDDGPKGAFSQADHFAAYPVSHGHHGHIGAQREKAHAHNQQNGPQQEHH